MNVGDYARTETGKIGKIIYFKGDMARVDCDKFITYKSNHNEITKISPNIIDLIEVGDYVNGHKVIYTIGNIHKRIYVEYVNMEELLEIKLEQIASIVTKEQFSQMEYKVGE